MLFCVFCTLVLSPCQTLGLLMVCSWWRWVIYYLGIIRISKNITIWQGTFSPSGVNEGGRSHCRELTIDCGLYTSLIIVVYQKDRMSNLAAEVTCWHFDTVTWFSLIFSVFILCYVLKCWHTLKKLALNGWSIKSMFADFWPFGK